MSEFKREDRYIVIKYTDLDRLPGTERRAASGFLRRLHESMFRAGAPARQSVVVESDWPEYHLVWMMLEHRMAGKPVPDFNAWRRADELQQRLSAAEQRVDELESLLEQVLTNAERGLPHDIYRSLRALLPRPVSPPANEAEREPFETWHRRRFATKHMTGAPTRDMHNGIHDPDYGPPNQQQMWEAWQARAALKPVEDLSDDA